MALTESSYGSLKQDMQTHGGLNMNGLHEEGDYVIRLVAPVSMPSRHTYRPYTSPKSPNPNQDQCYNMDTWSRLCMTAHDTTSALVSSIFHRACHSMMWTSDPAIPPTQHIDQLNECINNAWMNGWFVQSVWETEMRRGVVGILKSGTDVDARVYGLMYMVVRIHCKDATTDWIEKSATDDMDDHDRLMNAMARILAYCGTKMCRYDTGRLYVKKIVESIVRKGRMSACMGLLNRIVRWIGSVKMGKDREWMLFRNEGQMDDEVSDNERKKILGRLVEWIRLIGDVEGHDIVASAVVREMIVRGIKKVDPDEMVKRFCRLCEIVCRDGLDRDAENVFHEIGKIVAMYENVFRMLVDVLAAMCDGGDVDVCVVVGVMYAIGKGSVCDAYKQKVHDLMVEEIAKGARGVVAVLMSVMLLLDMEDDKWMKRVVSACGGKGNESLFGWIVNVIPVRVCSWLLSAIRVGSMYNVREKARMRFEASYEGKYPSVLRIVAYYGEFGRVIPEVVDASIFALWWYRGVFLDKMVSGDEGWGAVEWGDGPVERRMKKYDMRRDLYHLERVRLLNVLKDAGRLPREILEIIPDAKDVYVDKDGVTDRDESKLDDVCRMVDEMKRGIDRGIVDADIIEGVVCNLAKSLNRKDYRVGVINGSMRVVSSHATHAVEQDVVRIVYGLDDAGLINLLEKETNLSGAVAEYLFANKVKSEKMIYLIDGNFCCKKSVRDILEDK